MSEYTLLTSTSQGLLSEQVNRRLKEGWMLYGNPVMTVYFIDEDHESVYYFGQAMVRMQDDNRN